MDHVTHVVFGVVSPLPVAIESGLDAVHLDGCALFCHADGGGLVCDGADHVVHLVVHNHAVTEHRPVIHLDEEGVESHVFEKMWVDFVVELRGELDPPAARTLLQVVPDRLSTIILDATLRNYEAKLRLKIQDDDTSTASTDVYY